MSSEYAETVLVAGCASCPFRDGEWDRCLHPLHADKRSIMWHSLGYNEDGEDIALAPAWCPLRHAPLVLRFGPANEVLVERDEALAARIEQGEHE